METLKNGEKYYRLIINKVVFEFVQVFLLDDKIEIVDKVWGKTVAVIFKKDINSIEKY